MNVLIVDDEVSFRLLVKDYLVDEGFTVVLAENGEEGIEKLRKEKIDIVISDLHMHGMDGIKFCSVAREIPRFQSIPYLFVSAYGDEHTFGLLSSLKNSAFLSKGRPMNELVAMIHHLTTPVDQGGGFSPSDVPMEPSTKETQAREASTNDTISKNKSPEHSRILVVDDDEAFRILLSDMLGREGYVVITA
ncbi:MAG: response regulator, partial [Ignavibacteriales bacterium]|nr:response regulator [Ignavibacteriales bacterium]